ncbi:hypothetical protein [Euzebya sp.]|uniref:hypothetical protein n=1 Tax=Euzebya sp. TaxID=1971409 RepID=UPI003516E271
MNSGQVERRLDEIERLTQELRELLSSRADVVHVHGQGSWRADMLALLWPRVAHLAGVRALFELCAARSPEDVTFAELVARSGLSERAQANEHARLSRVARELFTKKTWPIENWQDAREGIMHYRMDPVVARWWQEVAAAGTRLHDTEDVASAIPSDAVDDLAGKWIAQAGEDVIAVGDSPDDVIAQVRESGRQAVVRRIPSSGREADIDLVV